MSNTDPSKVNPFMKFFWDEQQKYIFAHKNGVRDQPQIIRLAAKSPAMYEICFDEKTQSGICYQVEGITKIP